jgi:hypothetical protein
LDHCETYVRIRFCNYQRRWGKGGGSARGESEGRESERRGRGREKNVKIHGIYKSAVNLDIWNGVNARWGVQVGSQAAQ